MTAGAGERLAPRLADSPVGIGLRAAPMPAGDVDTPISRVTVREHLGRGPISPAAQGRVSTVQFDDDPLGDPLGDPLNDRFGGPLADEPFGLERLSDIAEETDPNKLKKIGEIQPFADYSPSGDPCGTLCPRPEDCPEIEDEDSLPRCPDEVTLATTTLAPRDFFAREYMWVASNVASNPLYFEDYVLERHGHTYGDFLQPFASAGLFSVQLIGLPYQMALDGPLTPIYAAGAIRPGDPAPKRTPQIPWNTKAAAVQAGSVAGFGLVLP